jgi:ABC-type multidrug transport system permease subunit
MIDRIRNNQLWQLTLASILEKIREPAVLFWGIGFPILMSIGLGLAFTRKSESLRHVALISPDTGSFSVTLRDEQLGTSTFQLDNMTWDEAMVRLKRGHVNLVVTMLDSGFRAYFDPMNADAQLTYLKLSPALDRIPGGTLRRCGTDTVTGGSIPAIELDSRSGNRTEIVPLTVTGTRYIDFLIPGMIAMGVMFSCLWGLGYGIIESRSKKLLRRMVATPMKKSNYLISLITVRMGMNIIEAGLLFLFAWLAFGNTIQGSVAALLVLFLAGNIAFSGIGIFLASRTSRTEIANGFINLVTMPMMVLSGIFFSYHNFPDWAISIIRPLPLTMYTDGIRSIFIEGAGFAETVFSSAILFFTGIIFFVAGLKIFKWH